MPPVQFNQWAGRGVQPFAIYGREGVMGEIGKGLSALGQIPQTLEDQRIQNEINKLVLQAITAPKTETETTQEEIPTFTLPEEMQQDYQQWPTGKSILTQPSEQPTFGESLTQEPTGTTILKSQREVPGKQYAQATQRLRDIGYANKDQGVNFTPRTLGQTFEERRALEELKGNLRKDVATTTEGAKTERQLTVEDRRQKGRIEKENLVWDRRGKLSEAHDKRMAEINAQTNKSREQVAKEARAEQQRWHDLQFNMGTELNRIRRANIGTGQDLRKSQTAERWINEMRDQDSQINKIRQLEGQADKNVVSMWETAVSRYNNARNELIKIDPSYELMPEHKLQDVPWYRAPSQLLPGGVPPKELAPTQPGQTTNPPRPAQQQQPRQLTPGTLPQTTPRLDETPEQRRERLLNR